MSLQPILLYTNEMGPNPKKVKIILEELDVPYTEIPTPNAKDEEYVRKVNPNGRLPTIIDPNNNNLKLWESGAVIEYLVETYDNGHKLSVSGAAEKWHLKQFLYFQVSGQGPYYGQAAWFHFYHEDDLESAKKRYLDQIDRVQMVLNDLLQDKEYLVGDKLTYVDLCFVPWEVIAHNYLGTHLKAAAFDAENKYPNYFAWYKRLLARSSVKKIMGIE